MNPHRPCANVGSLWILSAPLRMSKAFLRYSFSIVRAASMQRRRCRNARCDARALFTTFAPWPCTIGFRHLCQQLPPAPRARPARPRHRPRPPPPPKPSMGELASEHLSAGRATSAYCCSMPASRITLVQRSVSSFLSCAMSAGLPPPGRRCSCRYRSFRRASR